MKRCAFTLLELLLVTGMLAVIVGVSIPAYLDFRMRSDLSAAAEQVSQVLGRARLLAQAGNGASAWGLQVSQGTLFAGEDFAERDPTQDEVFAMPIGIVASGLEEVVFAPFTGMPYATGSILLQSSGRRGTIAVEVLVEQQEIVVNVDDRLIICHCESDPPVTLRVFEAGWPVHQAHGDTVGPCSEADPYAGCSNHEN